MANEFLTLEEPLDYAAQTLGSYFARQFVDFVCNS